MNSLSLYLHVPFCKAKCAYCDFYSVPQRDRIPQYERALLKSIAAWGEKCPHHRVETVYFGGGTPSLLSPEGLSEILCQIRNSFFLSPTAEITVELNPESATDSFLAAARESGVNRLSVGMQSCHNRELQKLGRLHDHEKTVSCVHRSRRLGFQNISLDLMYALPDQGVEDFKESLRVCLSLSPEHISFYCLTLSEHVPLFSERDRLPEDDTAREMYLLASRTLTAAGNEHYEISNAAKPGFASRHNKTYWQGGEYLGIGPGAHSFLGGRRFSTESCVEKFIESSSVEDMLLYEPPMDDEDRLTEYVMLSLRQSAGLDFSRLLSLSDEAFCRKTEKKMDLLSRHGLCRKTEAGFALTPEGFFVSNSIITELIG